jgi:hypothetical protein
MKRIMLICVAILVSSIVQGQESKTYRIKLSEWYIYSERTEEWVLQDRMEDINIDLVAYRNVVNIQAKTPTLYRLDRDTKKEVETENLTGYKYAAIECVDMKKCTVDIFVAKNPDVDIFVFSVIYDDKVAGRVNLRYFGEVK